MSQMGKIHAKLQPSVTALPKFASILIVDDQRFDRARLLRLIDELEFDTHVVQADCLETMGAKLQSDKFDLIFVDYNLPDGTGLQALDAIRLDPRNRQAAIIMIAGDGQNEIAIEALKRGCSDYITKDDISASSFRRASINALQKSHLAIGMETQDSKRKQMEEALERFSTECANEIKPVVSRVMRQLRDLREAPALSADQLADRYDRIERSCMRLWEFLDDLGRYQGTDISEEAFATQNFVKSLEPGAAPEAAPISDAAKATPSKPRRLQAPQEAPASVQRKRKPIKPSLFGKSKK